MGGPNEEKLDQAVQAQPGAIEDAADTWQQAADGLGKVREQLDTAKSQIAASWSGDDATAATSAFTSLSSNVGTNQTRMEQASTSLNTAASGIRAAQDAKSSLPPAGVMPGAPTPGADGTVTSQQKIDYGNDVDAANAADAQREKAALQAYNDLQDSFRDSQITMTAAAPPRYDTGGGTTTGGGGGIPGGTGGGTVGPYSTSTNGTQVHAQYVGGGIVEYDSLGHQVITDWHPGLPHPGFVPGTGTTADGTVGGTVGGVVPLNPNGNVGGTVGGLSGSLGTAPGSLAGGAVGGLSGVLGGAGGLLGALRGGSASSAAGAAGKVTGGLAGRLGGLGAVAGDLPEGTTGALGSTAARGGALGGTSRVGAIGSTPGATGSGAAGTTGGRTSMMPGSGGAGGQGGTAGAGGRGTSGRYAAAGVEEEAAAGRGGRSSTGMRSGGRAGLAAEEGGSGRGAAGTGGSTGQGRDEKAAKRKHMVFEDDDAWLEDDEAGPGVIR